MGIQLLFIEITLLLACGYTLLKGKVDCMTQVEIHCRLSSPSLSPGFVTKVFEDTACLSLCLDFSC